MADIGKFKSSIAYAELLRKERTEEEIRFITELFCDDRVVYFEKIAKTIPDSITTESLCESFEALHCYASGKERSTGDAQGLESHLILPQVKLMPLLAVTKEQLFKMLSDLVTCFGSYPRNLNEDLSAKVINIAYGVMTGMLKGNRWDSWKIWVHKEVQKSDTIISDNFTEDEQWEFISMLQCLHNVKDEGAIYNLARLLVKRGVVKNEVVDSYKKALEKRYIHEAGPLMKDTSRVLSDLPLNALTLARINELGAVKVMDAYQAGKSLIKAAK